MAIKNVAAAPVEYCFEQIQICYPSGAALYAAILIGIYHSNFERQPAKVARQMLLVLKYAFNSLLVECIS